VNGAVELRLPSESRATLSARATNGVVRADGLALATTGMRSRTRLEATLGGGGTPVTLETTNGSARIGIATAKPATPPESGVETAPPIDRARVANGAVSA
jgi:hypothetical protein